MEKDLLLRDIYYSPRVGYRSAEHLYELAVKENGNITRNYVKEWLRKQDSYTKNKKFSNPRKFRTTFVRDLGEQVQVDLVIFQKYKDENDGYQYILMAIEILSRQGFAIPLKRKDGKTTREAMEKFLDLFKTRFFSLPKLLQFDDGSEFLNREMSKFLDERDITFFTTSSKRKASIVERFNRTIKDKMIKMFERNGNHVWYTHISDLVYNYNTQRHSTIGMAPLEVTEDNKYEVWGRLFGRIHNFDKPKYKVGDRVRLLHFTPTLRGKEYQKFYRETHPTRINPRTGKKVREVALGEKKSPFSDEIFTIIEVLMGDPVMYKVFSEEAGVEILGKFYESEISIVR